MDADSFLRDRFVAVRQAVDAGTAAECRELIWRAMTRRGVRQADPATWPPLVRIDDLDAGPFTAAGLSPALTAAYDELIGPGRWTFAGQPRPRADGALPVTRPRGRRVPHRG